MGNISFLELVNEKDKNTRKDPAYIFTTGVNSNRVFYEPSTYPFYEEAEAITDGIDEITDGSDAITDK